MARTQFPPSTRPALKGILKVPTCALETAYCIAVRNYSNFTAPGGPVASDYSSVNTWVRSYAYDEELQKCVSPLRRRRYLLEVEIPVALSGLWVSESVEIGGVVIKAQRKIVRCAERASSRSPVRHTPVSPPTTCCNDPCRLSGKSTSSTCAKVIPDADLKTTSGQVDTREWYVGPYQQGATVSKAICIIDTYTVDDGWGVLVCVLKTWISIRRSVSTETTNIQGKGPATYSQDMRHPPHRVGEFVRVRGRLCVKPMESESGLELPEDFSRAFLRATTVYGARDVQEETSWFAEVYSQLQSMKTTATDSLGRPHHTPTSFRRCTPSLGGLSARQSV